MLTVADSGPTGVLASLVGRPPDDRDPKDYRHRRRNISSKGGTRFGRLRKCLVFLGRLAISVCCRKLDQEAPPGGAPVESLADAVSVPSEWGDLIDVMQHPTRGQITWLWFQDDEGTIRVVGYNTLTTRLSTDATVIHRR